MSKWHFIHNSYMLTCHDLGLHVVMDTTCHIVTFLETLQIISDINLSFCKNCMNLTVISYIDNRMSSTLSLSQFNDQMMQTRQKSIQGQTASTDSLPTIAFKDTALHFSSWSGTIECVPPVSNIRAPNCCWLSHLEHEHWSTSDKVSTASP